MNEFLHSCDLHVVSNMEPIKFVHKSSIDSPDAHKLHINGCFEIYVYISGKTNYIVQDKCYSLNRGDVVIINPFQVHAALLDETCQYERFYMLIPPSFFSGYAYDPLKGLHKSSLGNSSCIILHPDEREKMLNILYSISDLCENSDNANTSMVMYAYIIQVLCLLNVNRDKGEPDNVKLAHIPKLISDVLVYINQHLPEIRSTMEIANHFGVSHSYLSSMFKKYIKTPMKVYIRTQRITLAKKLLSENNSVTYACYESGFNDCSYFIKHFKESVGVTPLQYKQQLHDTEDPHITK